jgi:peptide/nickel transport system permease protein
MAAYLLRRLAYALLVGLGITAITFFISQVIPIDPAAAALGENAREEQIREFRERYGLDKPILVQYGLYLQRLLQLDLGRSLRTGRPVAEDLKEFFPATLELALAAFLVALALGLPAGIWAALRQNRSPDLLVRFSGPASGLHASLLPGHPPFGPPPQEVRALAGPGAA